MSRQGQGVALDPSREGGLRMTWLYGLGRRWCMDRLRPVLIRLIRMLLDTNRDRHAEVGHSIEDVATEFFGWAESGREDAGR